MKVFCFFILLTICSNPVKTQSFNKQKDKKKIMYNYVFFEGLKYKSLYNYNKAKENYFECISIDKNEAAAYYELALIFIYEKEIDQALFYIDKAVKIDQNNEWYLSLQADAFQNTGRYSKAAPIYQKLIKLKPKNIIYYEKLYTCYVLGNQILKAINILKDIELIVGDNKEIVFKKIDLYIEFGKLNLAEQEIDKFLLNNPRDLSGINKKVNILLIKGKTKEAEKHLNEILKIDDKNEQSLILLAEMYYNSDKNKFLYIFKKIIESNEITAQIKMKYILDYLYKDDFFMQQDELLQNIINDLILQYPDNDLVYIVAADIVKKNSITRNTKDSSLQFYIKSLEIDPGKEMVWMEVVIQYYELEDFINMEFWANKAQEEFPFSPEFFLYNSVAKYNLKKHNQAIENLFLGIDLIIDNDLLLARFYSILGDIYHDLNDHVNSDNYYEKSIERDSTNVYVLNNYSYYLSLREENLKRALYLIKQAVENVPDNPSFLDTYAWILYKLNNKEEALEKIKKALIYEDNNTTILDHYMDILCDLGEFLEAEIVRKKILKILNNNKKTNSKKTQELNFKISNKKCN